MKVIVITGGIGSGKSVACRFLSEEFGWPVYCADERVKQLYVDSPTLLHSIERELGVTFRTADGKFEPSALAKAIFSDHEALNRVEALVFPELKEDFMRWKIEHSDKNNVILESATILEKPQLAGIGDFILLIDAPVELRVSRAVERDKSDLQSIMRRVAAQPMMNSNSNSDAQSIVDLVICNDSSLENLYKQLRKFAEIRI